MRFVGELEAPDRSLTLRYRFAHHMYQNACFESLRATRKAALEPRDRRAPGGSGTASRPSVSPTSRCCSKSRETACAPPNTGTAPPRRPGGFTRTTNRRAWRSAGSALLANEPNSPARATAELGLQMTYALAIKTSKGYAVAGGRKSLRASP